MKLTKKIVCTLALLGFASSCQKNDPSGDADASQESSSDSAILKAFTDDVAIASYQDLADRSAALNLAAKALKTDPSEANFQAVRQAWIESRVPWEQSEAFLFGPVSSYSLDPALDSWPLDYSGIDAAVAQYAGADNIDLETEAVDVKGYHAIEFLLYGEGKTKTLAQQTANERAYLVALTENHSLVTKQILAAWQDGIKGAAPFKEIFINAGRSDNTIYLSTHDAIDELINKMVNIANEVGSTKIGAPFEQQNPNKVESQYSFNSLADFRDNVRSIRFVYQGNRTGTASVNSLSQRVASKDLSLNGKVEAAIDEALAAITAIPEPFRDAITQPSAKPSIEAAQAALLKLSEILNSDVRKALQK